MLTRSDRSDPGGRAGGLARVPLGATTLGVGRGLATESQKFHPGFFPELAMRRWITISAIALMLLVWIPVGLVSALVGALLAVGRQKMRRLSETRHSSRNHI